MGGQPRVLLGPVRVSAAAPAEEGAVVLAGSAVRARIAAGAQVIGPVTPVFRHLGEYGAGLGSRGARP